VVFVGSYALSGRACHFGAACLGLASLPTGRRSNVSERPPLYASFETVEHKRDMQTMERYKVLPEEPGLAHALDVQSTREGDPWRKYGAIRGPRLAGARRPHFYSHGGPRAACGTRVLVTVAMQFNTEDPDACLECAELVRNGEAWGRFAQPDLFRDECGEAVRIAEGERVEVYECHLRSAHRGVHRSLGATWETGPDDFIPAPDGYV
jgi:hypothetical protein